MMESAERIASEFHRTYEELAPSFGYATREASAKPWQDVPDNNRNLMIAVAQSLLDQGIIAELNPTPEPHEHVWKDTGATQAPHRTFSCEFPSCNEIGYEHSSGIPEIRS